MSWSSLNYSYWEFWAPFDPGNGYYGSQKCDFDGLNKLIYIRPEVTELNVKEDIYSNWKEWTQVRDNSKFDAAIRSIGGDPISNIISAGDIYFLINGWQIVIDHNCLIDGIIYSDDYDSPFKQAGNTQLVTNRVSNLVQTVSTSGSSGGSTALEIWSYPSRTLTSSPTYNGPSAVQIRQEMDTNSTKLSSINTTVQTVNTSVSGVDTKVDSISTVVNSIDADLQTLLSSMTPEQFWNYLLSNPMASGSAGEKLKQVLTTGNFLALK